MDALALLASAAARRPRGAAVRCGRRELSYPDLAALARRVGESLQRAGARSGDQVAALLPNCHLYLACYFGALQGGHVLVPLNTRLAQAELRAILDHSGARVLFGEPGRVATLAAPGPSAQGEGWMVAPVGPAAGRDDDERDVGRPPSGTAHLYYTSGTTGAPKGVILTRANLIAHVRMTLEELAFQEEDVWLHAAPMFHLADAWAVWAVTAAAATHVILPRYDPAAAFDLIESAGATITNLVPVMLRGLLEEAERRRRGLPSLRLLLSGGAPIAPGVVGRVGPALGCPYAQTYGLTETSPFLTFSLPDPGGRGRSPDELARAGARVGRAARGVEVRVVRPAGAEEFQDVPADDETVGEVVARGDTITPGYWRDPGATAEAFRGGWFHTGDLGTIDASGSINLIDRAKDVIVTGGETVYSLEVERVLHEHAAVREAAVFGVPDEAWGEAVRAAVVLREPDAAAGADLIAFCRGRIASFKCPGSIEFSAALPRTATGKVDKKALREPFWRGRARRVN